MVTTRSLRSSARPSSAQSSAAQPVSEKNVSASKTKRSEKAAPKKPKAKVPASTTKSSGKRKREIDEEAAASDHEEPDADEGEDEVKQKPAKKAKKPAAGKKEASANKSKDELQALREAPVPDINPDAERRDPPQTCYWLMKSEPEVRIEDGYEIKFSIDDLAAKTTPEGWEGIRNYVARNNLRDMRKGDKAFFYHSNCKEPGIIGIMTIAKEFSPDWNACINDNPYYEPKAPHDGSKWSLVHVKIEHKFPRIVPLRLIKDTTQEKGGPLQNMQLLKQSRLSVTKVTQEEWDEVIRMARELDEDDEWEKTVEESKKFPNYSA